MVGRKIKIGRFLALPGFDLERKYVIEIRMATVNHIGTLIGQSYNGTVLPLVGGFCLLGLATLVVMYWTGAKSTGVDEAG